MKQQAQPPGPTRNVLTPAKVSLLFPVRGGLTEYQNKRLLSKACLSGSSESVSLNSNARLLLALPERLRRVRLLTTVGSVECACPAEGADCRTQRCPEPCRAQPAHQASAVLGEGASLAIFSAWAPLGRSLLSRGEELGESGVCWAGSTSSGLGSSPAEGDMGLAWRHPWRDRLSLGDTGPHSPKLILALYMRQGFPGGASAKEPTCQCMRCKRRGFHPRVGKILWRRAWQPTPVFLPRESHGQRSLEGYSPQGRKRRTQLKGLSMHACIYDKENSNFPREFAEGYSRPIIQAD